MEGWIHEGPTLDLIHKRTAWKNGFMRGPHGRLDSCEDHMEYWIHVRTTWKTEFM